MATLTANQNTVLELLRTRSYQRAPKAIPSYHSVYSAVDTFQKWGQEGGLSDDKLTDYINNKLKHTRGRGYKLFGLTPTGSMITADGKTAAQRFEDRGLKIQLIAPGDIVVYQDCLGTTHRFRIKGTWVNDEAQIDLLD